MRYWMDRWIESPKALDHIGSFFFFSRSKCTIVQTRQPIQPEILQYHRDSLLND